MANLARVYFKAATALLGSLLFGLNLALLNTPLDDIAQSSCQGLCYTEQQHAKWIETYGAFLSTLLLITAAFASLVTGLVADLLGTWWAQLLTSFAYIIGSALSCSTQGTYWMIALGRAISGIGVGASSVLAPRYIADMAPPEVRGRLGTLHQVIINVGIVLALGLGLPYESHVQVVGLWGFRVELWRVMLASPIPLALLQAGLMLVIKASRPSERGWLAMESSLMEALKLEGNTEALSEHTEGPVGHETHAITTLFSRRYRRSASLALALPVFQQLSGINTIVLYSTSIFVALGLSSPIWGGIAIGLVNVAVTLLSAGLIDKAGRKGLLTWSHGGMAVGLAGLSLLNLFKHQLGVNIVSIGSLVCMSLYVAFFALGAGPVPWLYVPEVLPPEVIGPGQGLGIALNWFIVILISQFFPMMEHVFKMWGSYLIFCAFNVLAVVYLAYVMVETKGRSTQEIYALLHGFTQNDSRRDLLLA